MKSRLVLAAVLLGLGAPPAKAANSTVADAIKSREDLSIFAELLEKYGIFEELDSSYTVFAPTNDAFAGLPKSEFSCFYNFTCKEEAAVILRNHFVEREQPLSDIVGRKGGIFSISNQFLSVAEIQHDEYMISGQKVLSQHGLFGNLLYKIDGVIADDRQLMKLEQASYRLEKEGGGVAAPIVPAASQPAR